MGVLTDIENKIAQIIVLSTAKINNAINKMVNAQNNAKIIIGDYNVITFVPKIVKIIYAIRLQGIVKMNV